MLTEAEVRKRFAALKIRYLKRVLRRELRRRPQTCQFNRTHRFKRQGKQETVRLCVLGDERPDWDIDICDTAQRAMGCQAFILRKNREEVEEEFEECLRNPEYLREHYPELYALAWVLGDVETRYTFLQRLWLSWGMWWHKRKLLPPGRRNGVPQDD